jgi:ribose/xylose/arabinose/galactoside ABC-type transport system permease subunit
MVYPAWLARGAIGGQAGRAVFIVTLATVIVSVTLRLHLWFTSRSYPEQLDWARRRNGPWLRTCDWLFALTLIAAGLVVGDTPLGVTLVSVGIGAGAVFLVVEPVTTRAAFRN